MPFKLDADEINYIQSDQGPLTLIKGTLVDGEIIDSEWVQFGTAEGNFVALKMIGLEIDGPFTDSALRNLPGKVGKVLLVLDGHTTDHFIKAPTTAVGVGKRKPNPSKKRA